MDCLGIGRKLGGSLVAWRQVGTAGLDNGVVLGNRLVDLLGADQFLAGPLRDLARRPLLQQALRSEGLARRSALQALVADLQLTYAPAVLAELIDLLETGLLEPGLGHPAGSGHPASGNPGLGNRGFKQAGSSPLPLQAAVAIGPGAIGPVAFDSDSIDSDLLDSDQPDSGSLDSGSLDSRLKESLSKESFKRATRSQQTFPRGLELATAPGEASTLPSATGALHQPPGSLRRLGKDLRRLAPGLAMAAAMALVLSWLAKVLDQGLLRPSSISGGVVLVLLLAGGQLASFGPLRRLRPWGLLSQQASADPRLAWRWVTAPWLHARTLEALLNGLLLLLILGRSPLALNELVLRYGLTSLASLALAALTARRLGLRHQEWGGASGAVGALIGLAVGQALLRWREIGFGLGRVTIPAWVLLVVVGCLQLAWILPRRHPDDGARPGQRLLASQWWWGLVLGLAWALLSWGSALVQLWWRQRLS
jgi:membrane associated rhomboid family serine protease